MSDGRDKSDRNVCSHCCVFSDVLFVSCHSRSLGGVLLPGHLPWPVTQSSGSSASSSPFSFFSVLHRHSSSQSSFSIAACGSRSHFHVSGTPISVTLPCLPVSLENSQPSLGSSRKGNSDFSIPRTVRSALLTLVIQIIIWFYLTAIHTLVPIPLLPMLCQCPHFVF